MPRRISLSKTKRKNFKILLRLLFLRWYKKCILFLGGFGILTILCYNNRSLSSSSTTTSSTSSTFLRTRGAEHAGDSAGSASNAQDNNNNNIALRKVKSRPNKAKWMNMTRNAWHEELGCDKLTIRPVHTPEVWIGMREAYISVVGQEMATVPSTTTSSLSSSELSESSESLKASLFKTAFQIPFEVRQSPGMGRGIYTLIDVKKGQLLYDFSQTAQYRYANEFAEFLRIITPDLACDVLMWSYVQELSEGYTEKMSNDYGPFRIMTDLDPGSFCNNGGTSKGNMAWIITTTTTSTTTNHKTAPIIGRYDTVKSAPLVALRDIDAGEELLCIYSQFSEGLNKMIE
ncbi:hypothetical protein FRACYDRAFT_248097 [Fragilariopsis cylindrus CCMP1102]|uniref:SET domain-containing protein n=1 Tax=Fragilariopsis cylindrus CCMP1102 TaxID=635003 RepID=A0A1E7EVG8_9STRA|nr:hypothetical protein FRACYDRAFT_248097 [Fragilariopsis cylindrus CCMP1102]|eukprot:OEU09847.1 hypothetical protein FRACYDRAFT_248097 [Fragilariopsis cylindrus CCMP1102]